MEQKYTLIFKLENKFTKFVIQIINDKDIKIKRKWILGFQFQSNVFEF